jgi:hypothetical protein
LIHLFGGRALSLSLSLSLSFSMVVLQLPRNPIDWYLKLIFEVFFTSFILFSVLNSVV